MYPSDHIEISCAEKQTNIYKTYKLIAEILFWFGLDFEFVLICMVINDLWYENIDHLITNKIDCAKNIISDLKYSHIL